MIEPGIFKANDIRGVATGDHPQWDTDGAYVLGAALVDALDLTAAALTEAIVRWCSAGTCGPPARSSPGRSPRVR